MAGTGLIYKEWQQSKLAYVLLWLFVSLQVPLLIWSAYSNYLETLKHNKHAVFQLDFENHLSLGFTILFPFFLALSQLGLERSRGTMDFTLALPFSRRRLFLTKWISGIASLLGSVLISYLIAAAALQATHAVVTGINHHYLLYAASLLMFYSLFFAAGCLTGTAFAQGLVAFSTAIFPVLAYLLILSNLNVFHIYPDNGPWNHMNTFSPLSYTSLARSGQLNIWVPVSYAIIFSIIAYFCFQKQPAERNGSFFLWKQLNAPVQAIVVLLGVLGFGAAGHGFSSGSIVGYVLGLIIGAAAGFAVSYFIIYRKYKLG
ncbi:ABC transporter permease [Metabacillus sp. GX 13764]|uniref:ABC transporter permease n=1 Tax=Metabacillus kandeliae TaxID=2900151 RepID=UPI001E3A8D39|nr:ABC transporter permease subunit [Metabacillus kandeliae]MCD7032670.1 ABC transporter permease [Metabacillus kandeliae]